MAQGDSNIKQDMASEEEQRLKYLEFVQVATVHAVLCFTNLYLKAKEKSGPLKTGVETVEGTVKTVVGPVYEKYHDVPAELLKFVDRKYEPAAKGLYAKYEPKAEQCAVSAWRKLNQLPVFPKVASVVVPTAAYCSDKYNQTVVSTAEKGYKVASYLPLVPTEKIAKVFSEEKPESQPLVSES
ncbi:Rubber elongation factor [Corchorus capsularis]|uniref:Rubber elongation factor n=1 Tax=Corchorus capsularis TaxID=210143 RepID=A0A1R3IVY2_COCAP|nr:Rubber elongation factor [Corchorus capsularis]